MKYGQKPSRFGAGIEPYTRLVERKKRVKKTVMSSAAPISSSETWPPNRGYPATVLDVHDGDTLTARLDLGFMVSTTIKVRLAGVNAPELNAPGGQEAATYLDDLLAANEQSVRVYSHKHQESFARWVCDVTVGFQPADVASLLVENGHAKRE